MQKRKHRVIRHGVFHLAAGEGFEPSHTESESAVLPLHKPAISKALDYYTKYRRFVKEILQKTFLFFSPRDIVSRGENIMRYFYGLTIRLTNLFLTTMVLKIWPPFFSIKRAIFSSAKTFATTVSLSKSASITTVPRILPLT